jgi:hypothetical protein
MKPFILVEFSNGAKFRNYICWLINYINSHHLPCEVNNKDLVFMSHVKIGL